MSRETYYETRIPQPGAEKGHVIEADLYYSLGGYNYFSGQADARGLWISFAPVELTPSSLGGVMVKSMTVGDKRGRRFLLKELPRKNKKQGEAAVATFKALEEKVMWAAAHQDWPLVRDLLGQAIH